MPKDVFFMCVLLRDRDLDCESKDAWRRITIAPMEKSEASSIIKDLYKANATRRTRRQTPKQLIEEITDSDCLMHIDRIKQGLNDATHYTEARWREVYSKDHWEAKVKKQSLFRDKFVKYRDIIDLVFRLGDGPLDSSNGFQIIKPWRKAIVSDLDANVGFLSPILLDDDLQHSLISLCTRPGSSDSSSIRTRTSRTMSLVDQDTDYDDLSSPSFSPPLSPARHSARRVAIKNLGASPKQRRVSKAAPRRSGMDRRVVDADTDHSTYDEQEYHRDVHRHRRRRNSEQSSVIYSDAPMSEAQKARTPRILKTRPQDRKITTEIYGEEESQARHGTAGVREPQARHANFGGRVYAQVRDQAPGQPSHVPRGFQHVEASRPPPTVPIRPPPMQQAASQTYGAPDTMRPANVGAVPRFAAQQNYVPDYARGQAIAGHNYPHAAGPSVPQVQNVAQGGPKAPVPQSYQHNNPAGFGNGLHQPRPPYPQPSNRPGQLPADALAEMLQRAQLDPLAFTKQPVGVRYAHDRTEGDVHRPIPNNSMRHAFGDPNDLERGQATRPMPGRDWRG